MYSLKYYLYGSQKQKYPRVCVEVYRKTCYYKLLMKRINFYNFDTAYSCYSYFNYVTHQNRGMNYSGHIHYPMIKIYRRSEVIIDFGYTSFVANLKLTKDILDIMDEMVERITKNEFI